MKSTKELERELIQEAKRFSKALQTIGEEFIVFTEKTEQIIEDAKAEYLKAQP